MGIKFRKNSGYLRRKIKMANLSWYEAFGAADCVSGHATWNDMTDYIKHSALYGFYNSFYMYKRRTGFLSLHKWV